MDKVKPWQVILFFVAVAVLGFSVWKFGFGSRIAQPDRFMTVDVLTGQLYEIELGRAKGMILPAKHPQSGLRVLFPVMPSGDGWKVEPGFVDAARSSLVPDSIVSPQGEITVLDTTAQTIVLVP